MKDVNSELVQHFVSRSPVSPKTTRNVCITLQSMWATAKAWGYVAHNIMEGICSPLYEAEATALRIPTTNPTDHGGIG